MRRAVFVFIAAVSVFTFSCKSGEKQPTQESAVSNTTDKRALVQQILESTTPESIRKRAIWQKNTPLFEALARLAQLQGKKPEDYTTITYKGAFIPLSQGHAVKLSSGGKVYVVVILTAEGESIPGTAAEQLVLITEDGEILDKLFCEINSRYGSVGTQVKSPPEPDGAQLAIVFFPGPGNSSRWHNWHTISYGGKRYTFSEKESKEPTVWDEKGLCRVKIEDDKFVVLFPELKEK
jgi:hypothetical protein